MAGHIRKTPEDRVVNTAVYLFLGLVFFATAYPFYLSLVLSFNEGLDAARGGNLSLAPGIHPGKLPQFLYR
jgi:ABC-type glycerol-3-phosphate transport system permease component